MLEGTIEKVIVGNNLPIALYKVGDQIYATTNICTHAQCELDHNHAIYGDVVECTCHGSRFDIKSGAVILPPAVDPLKTYPVTVEEEDVVVEV